jgi:dTDP-glucose 4,6-dehydratase
VTREGYARLEANIADRALIRAVLREFAPDAVIHLAASTEEDNDALFDGEIGGAYSVLEAARCYHERLSGDVRERFRIVHAERAESDIAEALSRQQAARGAASALMERWSRANGLPLVTCVAGEAFGPWQSHTSFFARLLTYLLHEQPIALRDAGETVRDWLPIRDFASGILLAAEVAPAGSRIDFSVGAERRDVDLAEFVCGMLDERMPRPSRPWASLLTLEGAATSAGAGPMLDQTEAERLLGWQPTGFHAGLERLLNWAIASHEAAVARRTIAAD